MSDSILPVLSFGRSEERETALDVLVDFSNRQTEVWGSQNGQKDQLAVGIVGLGAGVILGAQTLVQTYKVFHDLTKLYFCGRIRLFA